MRTERRACVGLAWFVDSAGPLFLAMPCQAGCPFLNEQFSATGASVAGDSHAGGGWPWKHAARDRSVVTDSASSMSLPGMGCLGAGQELWEMTLQIESGPWQRAPIPECCC